MMRMISRFCFDDLTDFDEAQKDYLNANMNADYKDILASWNKVLQVTSHKYVVIVLWYLHRYTFKETTSCIVKKAFYILNPPQPTIISCNLFNIHRSSSNLQSNHYFSIYTLLCSTNITILSITLHLLHVSSDITCSLLHHFGHSYYHYISSMCPLVCLLPWTLSWSRGSCRQVIQSSPSPGPAQNSSPCNKNYFYSTIRRR